MVALTDGGKVMRLWFRSRLKPLRLLLAVVEAKPPDWNKTAAVPNTRE